MSVLHASKSPLLTAVDDDDDDDHDDHNVGQSPLIAHDLDAVVSAEADGGRTSFDGVVVLQGYHHHGDHGGGWILRPLFNTN